MKCQRCDKRATFHITELTGANGHKEIHLCEVCISSYLHDPASNKATSGTIQNVGPQAFKMAQTAEELAELDQKCCPVCGMAFYEFRQAGRLGCPHDYVCFERELEPLLGSIHGKTRHTGKTPRLGRVTTEAQTQLIRLRREMHEAVQCEDYERAGRLRDQIRRLEEQC
ncbi:MAG: UvrB/UvrC protein [Pirellulaceae bacterium]|nr:MAG: UvrB/UvrC protein [Pirellulaceae bacterium]GIW90999.1 MAG: UvrB/UvrC protein [Pirellulaceae bacterium]GIW93163.1 MAG: UvrB/UvrC protein [Pirellulaceae bacterium]